MVLNKKVYGVKTLILVRFSNVYGVDDHHPKKRKPVALQSEIGNLAGLQLQLQFISNQGDELRICGFSFGVADRVPKEALKGIQITSVPGYFDGVTDSSFYTAGGGLEGFCHLGVQNLGDGVDDVHVVDGDNDGLPQILVALDVGGNADGVRCHVHGVNVLVFIKLLLL